MRLFKCCAAAAVAVLYLGATETTAAEFSFVSLDPPGFGMNDPTPRSPVGGNPGTTLGNPRLFALQEAGPIWGRFLHSEVPIRVDVEFASLGRSPGGTPLATAGAEDYESNFLNAPSDDVFYPVALANSLAGFDLEPSRSDIAVTINESLDSSPLPGGWYYGFDDNTPPDQTNFIDVVLHELGHYHGLDEEELRKLGYG